MKATLEVEQNERLEQCEKVMQQLMIIPVALHIVLKVELRRQMN
jgi:hypothetical protein